MGCGTSKVNVAEEDNDGNNVNANGIEASAKSTNETSVIVNGSLEDEVENFPRAKNGEDVAIEESLPGRTVLDKSPLPPIKSKNNHHQDSPIAGNVRPKTSIPAHRSPKKLPKLTGRPAARLPYDLNSLSEVDKANSLQRLKEAESKLNDNFGEDTTHESPTKRNVEIVAAKLEAIMGGDADDEASLQNEKNENLQTDGEGTIEHSAQTGTTSGPTGTCSTVEVEVDVERTAAGLKTEMMDKNAITPVNSPQPEDPDSIEEKGSSRKASVSEPVIADNVGTGSIKSATSPTKRIEPGINTAPEYAAPDQDTVFESERSLASMHMESNDNKSPVVPEEPPTNNLEVNDNDNDDVISPAISRQTSAKSERSIAVAGAVSPKQPITATEEEEVKVEANNVLDNVSKEANTSNLSPVDEEEVIKDNDQKQEAKLPMDNADKDSSVLPQPSPSPSRAATRGSNANIEDAEVGSSTASRIGSAMSSRGADDEAEDHKEETAKEANKRPLSAKRRNVRIAEGHESIDISEATTINNGNDSGTELNGQEEAAENAKNEEEQALPKNGHNQEEDEGIHEGKSKQTVDKDHKRPRPTTDTLYKVDNKDIFSTPSKLNNLSEKLKQVVEDTERYCKNLSRETLEEHGLAGQNPDKRQDWIKTNKGASPRKQRGSSKTRHDIDSRTSLMDNIQTEPLNLTKPDKDDKSQLTKDSGHLPSIAFTKPIKKGSQITSSHVVEENQYNPNEKELSAIFAIVRDTVKTELQNKPKESFDGHGNVKAKANNSKADLPELRNESSPVFLDKAREAFFAEIGDMVQQNSQLSLQRQLRSPSHQTTETKQCRIKTPSPRLRRAKRAEQKKATTTLMPNIKSQLQVQPSPNRRASIPGPAVYHREKSARLIRSPVPESPELKAHSPKQERKRITFNDEILEINQESDAKQSYKETFSRKGTPIPLFTNANIPPSPKTISVSKTTTDKPDKPDKIDQDTGLKSKRPLGAKGQRKTVTYQIPSP